MPWITHKGKHISDSQAIIEYINDEFKIDDMNGHLSDTQKYISLSYRLMMEDALYFIINYRRYIDVNAKGVRNHVFYLGSWLGNKGLMVKMIKNSFVKYIEKQLFAQGISRYTVDGVYKRGDQIILSIMGYMGNNKYFFGDKISEIDIIIYAFLSGMYCNDFLWKNKDGKLPKRDMVTEYIKRIEMDCYGKLKYWKDINIV